MVPILEQVWCRGTAKTAPRIEGYSVAGKTGTGYIAQNAKYMVVGADGKLARGRLQGRLRAAPLQRLVRRVPAGREPEDHDPGHHRRSAR